MATEAVLMAAVSSPDSWTLAAGASKTVAVATADGTTAYINSGTTNNTQQQFHKNAPTALKPQDTIGSVTLTAVLSRGGASNCDFTGTVVTGGGNTTFTGTATNGFGTFTSNLATKPAGGAWTFDDFCAAEFRIQNTQARDLRCTQLLVTANYTAGDNGNLAVATVGRWTGTPAVNTDITSGSVTPVSANGLIVVEISADETDSTEIALSVTDSRSRTYTLRARHGHVTDGTNWGHAAIYTAPIGTANATTINVRRTSTHITAPRISVTAKVYTDSNGVPGLGATGSGFSTTNNLTPTLLTSTVNNSVASVVATDWAQNGLMTSNDLIADSGDYAGFISAFSGYRWLGNTGSKTGNINCGGTAATVLHWAALEITPYVASVQVLTCSPGTVTWTGQSATLKASRLITANAGSLTWTGQSAILKASRLITAAAGSLTWTGQPATLSLTRKITANAGSLTWTGQAATLTASRVLTVSPGTITWTGQDATLSILKILTANAGSLTWTGQSASLIASRLLTSQPGSLTWAGQAATLAITRLVTAQAGSITWTGQSASLVTSRVLTCGPGTLTWTGQSASLMASRKIAASAGSLTWTGQIASLIASRKIIAAPGSLTWTGQLATLTKSSSSSSGLLLIRRRLAASRSIRIPMAV